MGGIDVDSLKVGTQIRIGWLPDRLCVIKYLGNSKLCARSGPCGPHLKINKKSRRKADFLCPEQDLNLHAIKTGTTPSK